MLDWFRRRKNLIIKAEYHRDRHKMLMDLIRTSDDIKELRELTSKSIEECERDAKILEGSDIGKGVINISHWSARLLAINFYEVLKSIDAPNYIEIRFNPTPYYDGDEKKITDGLLVTIQYVNGESPTDQIKKLKARIAELEAKQP